MADNVIARAIVEIGATGVADAKAQIATLEKGVKTLEAGYKTGKVSLNEYIRGVATFRNEIKQLATGVAQAEAAIKKYGSAQAASAAMAKKASASVQQAGSQGAMGLMVLSQTIDDAQYGFKSIVNNLPQLGMAVGSAFGMSTEAAMKFGGAIGIAGVAINTWIKNWDDAKEAFGGDWSSNISKKFYEITDAILSAGAAVVNFSRSASLTQIDLARIARAKEQKKATKEQNEADAKAAESSVSGVDSDATQERGKAFKEALEAYGGGDKLRAELSGPMEQQALRGVENRAKAARDKSSSTYNPAFDIDKEREDAKKKVRDAVNLRIAGALRGDMGAGEGIGKDNPAFGKMQGITEQREIEAKGRANDRAYQQRQKDKAKATAAMLQDTVGTTALANPATSLADLEKLTKKAMADSGLDQEKHGDPAEVAKQLKYRLKEKIGAYAAQQGITDAEAEKRLAFESKDKLKRQGEDGVAGREATRVTGALEHGGVGRELLANPKMDEDALKSKIRNAMEAAGASAEEIVAVLPIVARKLKEKLEKAVEDRALDRGISTDEARKLLVREENEKAKQERIKDAGPKAQVMSTDQYLSKLLTAGLNKADTTPKDQLEAAKTTNKKLDEIKEALAKDNKRDFVATFAAGRGRR